MRLSDYDFELPDELIAAYPVEHRDESRLLVVDRARQTWSHHQFRDLPGFLAPEDMLVVNNTRVLPGRVYGRKDTGGQVELLFVRPLDGTVWLALARGKNLGIGTRVRVGDSAVELMGREGDAWRVETGGALSEMLRQEGQMPLPPYIVQRRRALGHAEQWTEDSSRYQTVFAAEAGAVAAPTAGLHFTPAVLDALANQGTARTDITLHVGPGTFLPIRGDEAQEHQMHAEQIEVSAQAAEAILARKNAGGKVVAVGTTVVRALEGVAGQGGLRAFHGETDIYILPGYSFAVVDRLLTNFHLPKSTLLLLVAAFTGRDLLLEAYQDAVRNGYRFYSYGDAMLIL